MLFRRVGEQYFSFPKHTFDKYKTNTIYNFTQKDVQSQLKSAFFSFFTSKLLRCFLYKLHKSEKVAVNSCVELTAAFYFLLSTIYILTSITSKEFTTPSLLISALTGISKLAFLLARMNFMSIMS